MDSRNLANRRAVQDDLVSVLTRLNGGEQAPLSPFTVTLGDEFQAVFDHVNGFFLGLLTILDALYPIKIRFSIGVGTLSTPINRDQALGMDGPAFYQARKGMDRLKKNQKLFILKGLPEEPILNASLNLASLTLAGLKQNRLRTLLDLMTEIDVKQIAKELNISKTAVYKGIQADSLRELQEVFQVTEATLKTALTS